MDPEYYSWSRCWCQRGTAGHRGMCGRCPFGAECSNGTELRAGRRMWCDESVYKSWLPQVGEVTPEMCFRCQQGCCESQSCSLSQQCSRYRTGRLCGACEPQMSAALFTDACMRANECEGNGWYFALFAVLLSLFVLFRILRFSPAADVTVTPGLKPVFMQCLQTIAFFYQIFFVATGRLTKHMPAWLSVPTGIFNMEIDARTSSGQGLCVIPGLTMPGKAALSYVCPACALGAVALLLPLGLFQRKRLESRGTTAFEGHMAAFLLCTDLAYGTVLQTTLSLLKCQWVSDTLVMALSGPVECYTEWQKVLFVVLIPIVAYPVGLGFWVRYRARRSDFPRSATFSRMVAPYRVPHWGVVPLVQRQILLIVYVFVTNPTWQSVGVFVICAVILVANLVFSPRRWAQVRGVELGLLLVVVVVAGFNLYSTVFVEMALEDSERVQQLEWAVSALSLVPIPLAVMALLYTDQRVRHKIALYVAKCGFSFPHDVKRSDGGGVQCLVRTASGEEWELEVQEELCVC